MLPVNNFEWIKETSRFNEGFIKNYNGESDEEYFLGVDVQYPEKFYERHNGLPFLPERKELKKSKSLLLICTVKMNQYVIHKKSLKQSLNN